MFEEQRNRVLSSLDKAHHAYHKKPAFFSGPSVYFHVRSLRAARAQDLDRFAEYAYAMLSSWGMHQPGSGGPKMKDFDEFYSSLKSVWSEAIPLRQITLSRLRGPDWLSKADWGRLKKVFCGIRCMTTNKSLVANSKVMANLLPNLIPPIDGKYTLRFLYNSKNIPNTKMKEWAKLVDMLKHFFYPIVSSKPFRRKVKKWLIHKKWAGWNTSPLKIVDNLVVGLERLRKASKTE